MFKKNFNPVRFQPASDIMVETTSVVTDDKGFTSVVDKVISAEELEKQKVDASQFTLDAKLKAGVPLIDVNVNLPGSDIEPGLINSSLAKTEKEDEEIIQPFDND